LAPLLLELAGVDNGGPLAELLLDLTAVVASEFESLHDLERLLVGDLAEDDVAAIEPRGDNGGDEELRAVAATVKARLIRYPFAIEDFPTVGHSRVLAGVGHGEEAGPVVPELEVLIGELLAIDGLATSALRGLVSILSGTLRKEGCSRCRG